MAVVVIIQSRALSYKMKSNKRSSQWKDNNEVRRSKQKIIIIIIMLSVHCGSFGLCMIFKVLK